MCPIRMAAMEGGLAENSYAAQSKVQRMMWAQAAPLLLDELKESFHLLNSKNKDRIFHVADLGCSSSVNTILQMNCVTEVLHHCHSAFLMSSQPDQRMQDSKVGNMQIMAYFSDLPSNDFNTLLRLFPAPPQSSRQLPPEMHSNSSCDISTVNFHKILSEVMTSDRPPSNARFFAAGVSGSFYSQLFPSQALHLAMSSTALHFLSRVPDLLTSGKLENKGRIRPPSSVIGGPVREAFCAQAHDDLCTFLRMRANELVSGGLLWMLMLGDCGEDFPDVNVDAWQALIEEGKLSQDSLDKFNMPFYDRSPEDIQAAVDAVNGLFSVKVLKMIEYSDFFEPALAPEAKAKQIAGMLLAVMRPTVRAVIGEEGAEAFSNKMLEQTQQQPQRFLSAKLDSVAVVLLRA
eukprot:jgi/Mesen1/7992/ME000425S07191